MELHIIFVSLQPPLSPHKLDHNHVLEHSLHQLLRELHHKNVHFPPPHPVTAMIGVSKKRRLAGSTAMSKRELLEMTERLDSYIYITCKGSLGGFIYM